jgi:hypothetical protein
VNTLSAEEQQRLEHLLGFKKWDVIGSSINTFIRYFFLFGIAVMMFLTARVLAGKYTFAQIGVKFLADFKISDAVYIALSGGSIIYGLEQRRLRRKSIERITPRNKELELKIDARRSSSGLSPRGTSRPEDF